MRNSDNIAFLGGMELPRLQSLRFSPRPSFCGNTGWRMTLRGGTEETQCGGFGVLPLWLLVFMMMSIDAAEWPGKESDACEEWDERVKFRRRNECWPDGDGKRCDTKLNTISIAELIVYLFWRPRLDFFINKACSYAPIEGTHCFTLLCTWDLGKLIEGHLL